MLTGVLGACTASAVVVDVGSTQHQIPFEDILSGHLVFEFGPAPKPGKKK